MPLTKTAYENNLLNVDGIYKAIHDCNDPELFNKNISKWTISLTEMLKLISEEADSTQLATIKTKIKKAKDLLQEKLQDFELKIDEVPEEAVKIEGRKDALKDVYLQLGVLKAKRDEFAGLATERGEKESTFDPKHDVLVETGGTFAKARQSAQNLYTNVNKLCAQYVNNYITLEQFKACTSYIFSDNKKDIKVDVLDKFPKATEQELLIMENSMNNAKNSVMILNTHRDKWGIKGIIAAIVDACAKVAPPLVAQGLKFFRPDTDAGGKARGLGKTMGAVKAPVGTKTKEEFEKMESESKTKTPK